MDDRVEMPMTLERLHVILDAYGGAPERWPAAERAAATRLVEQSAVARGLWEEARTLDGLLDALPSEDPSAALVERVLAAAPRVRRPRRWTRPLAIAVPLAAAAALALWWTTSREAVEPVATVRLDESTLLALGGYSGPTDVLLGGFTVDFVDHVPAVGCSDATLGCTDLDDAAERSSRNGTAAGAVA